MTRILFTTTPFSAHMRMTRPVVQALVAAGHEVCWYTGPHFEALVTGTGAAFARSAVPPRDPAQRPKVPAKPPAGLIDLFFTPIPTYAADLVAHVDRFEPDVIVSDPTFRAGVFVAERCGIALVALANGPLDLSSVDTAPFGPGWPPPASAAGRLRNRWRYWSMRNRACRELQRAAVRIRADLGLPPIDGYYIDWVARIADRYLLPSVPEFEYPRSDLPASVRFVGLLRETGIDDDWTPPPWWPDLAAARRAGRPVVFLTQGTIATDPANLLLPAAEALASSDVLLVASTSGGDPDELMSTAGHLSNLRLARFVPYPVVLPLADLAITNGGYGGTQTALSYGVPLVVSGTSEDKRETNARVAHTGAGVSLGTNAPTAAQLRTAAHQVLADPAYRAHAQRMKAAYARHLGAPAAAAAILDVAATRHHPPAPAGERG